MDKLCRAADAVLGYSFYLLFFLVPLVFSPVNSELFELPKMVLTYVLTVVITSSWAIKSIINGRLIFRRTPLDIFLLIFLVSQFLSFSVSVDPHTSLWGYYSRSHGGLLSTISYMLLYWAFVSNMTLRTTHYALRYLLSSATLVAAWGVLEHFGVSPSCLILGRGLTADCWIQDVQTRVFATLGQPNWMAAWLVALMPISWAFALNSKLKSQNSKLQLKSKNLVWLILSGLFFLALLYTKSRSGLLGFAAAYGVFWGFTLYKYRKHFKNFLIFTFLFLILTLASQRVTSYESQVTSGTTLETDITPSSEIRKIVWKGAADAWRAYPIFGSGVETFAYVYYQFRPAEHNLTSEWDFLYNKAHNEYLNFAATTGTFGLGTYLLLVSTVLYLLVKLKGQNSKVKTTTQNLKVALLAGYASILITNFFGFSVVPVATLFFLFPAMAKTMVGSNKAQVTSYKSRSLKQFISIFILLLVTCYLLLRIGVLWYADVLYARAKEQNRTGEVGKGIENAQRALRLHPGEPNYWDELAQGYGLLAASLELDDEQEEATERAVAAVQASDMALEISPRNISLLKSRAVILTQLAEVGEKYLFSAIGALEKARILAPTEPKIPYNLGVLYSRVGQIEQAKELLQKALELKPDYDDPKEALEALEEG